MNIEKELLKIAKTFTPSLFEIAKQIAIEAHAGQTRRGGEAYISHPLAVAKKVQGQDAKVVAVLHDVIEDTSVTEQDLKKKGIPNHIIEAVKLLSKTPNESKLPYLKRIKTNPLAKAVKIADMEHNLNDNPSKYQIGKYTYGLKYLKGELTDEEYLQLVKSLNKTSSVEEKIAEEITSGFMSYRQKPGASFHGYIWGDEDDWTVLKKLDNGNYVLKGRSHGQRIVPWNQVH